MTFEEFRKDLENKLKSIAQFELIEYHYAPYAFGAGLIAFRIFGQIHKLIYEGKENELTWLINKSHKKYNDLEFKEFKKKRA